MATESERGLRDIRICCGSDGCGHAPMRTIYTSSGIASLALDSSGQIYALTQDGIDVFASSASGNAAPVWQIFVTAEPEGVSAKPTGEPLLLAYLKLQPNHPSTALGA